MSFDDTGPDTVYRIEGGKESAPYTPQIERSFDVEGVDTGNADDRMFAAVGEWEREQPEQLVDEFVGGVGRQISGFLDRHMNELPSNIRNALLADFKYATSLTEKLRDNPQNADLQYSIYTVLIAKVLPELKVAFRTVRRAGNARGVVEQVPGRASDRREERRTSMLPEVRRNIQQQVRDMPEYEQLMMHTQSYNQQVSLPSSGQTVEYFGIVAEIKRRETMLWRNNNLELGGAFDREYQAAVREQKKAEKILEEAIMRQSGQGAASAYQNQQRRKQLRPLPSKPWERKRRGPTRSMQQPGEGSMLRLRGGGEGAASRSVSSSRRSVSSSRERYSSRSVSSSRGETAMDSFRKRYPGYDPVRISGNTIVPIAPLQGSSEVYEKVTGIKAKDALELFQKGSGFVDSVQSVLNIVETLQRLDPQMQMNMEIPENVLKQMKSSTIVGTRNMDEYEGLSIQTAINKAMGKNIDIYDLGNDDAEKLIAGTEGLDHSQSQAAFNKPIKTRALLLGPWGFLNLLWDGWRRSNVGLGTKYTEVLPVQFMEYRRGGRYFEDPARTRFGEKQLEVMGKDKPNLRLKLLTKMFRGNFPKGFWSKPGYSVQAQLQYLKGEGASLGKNRNTSMLLSFWIELLEKGFGVDVDRLVGGAKSIGSYSEKDTEKVWGVVSEKMKAITKDMHTPQETVGVHDYALSVQNYARSLTSSASRSLDRPSTYPIQPRRQDREPENSPVGAQDVDDAKQEAVAVAPPKKRKVGRKSLFTQIGTFARGMPIPPSTFGLPGKALFDMSTKFGEHKEGGVPAETIKHRLGSALWKAYKKSKSSIVPLKLNRRTLEVGKSEDKEAFYAMMERLGWNLFIEQYEGGNVNRDEDATAPKLYKNESGPIFLKEDDVEIREILRRYVAVSVYVNIKRDQRSAFSTEEQNRIAWYNEHPGFNPVDLRDDQAVAVQGERIVNALSNVKDNYEALNNQVGQKYTAMEEKARRGGVPFPIPGWKTRLQRGQWGQLEDVLKAVERQIDKLIAEKSAPQSTPPSAPAPAQDVPEEGMLDLTEELMPSREASLPRAQRPRAQSVDEQRYSRRDRSRSRSRSRDLSSSRASSSRERERLYQDLTRSRESSMSRRSSIGSFGSDLEDVYGQAANWAPAHNAVPLEDIAADEEKHADVAYMRPMLPFLHNDKVSADKLRPNMYHMVAAREVLQSEHGRQAAMGAVHMVRPEANYSDKHFMVDAEGDINEGAKVVKERSRRGPFRQERGRSTIMDRSAHVMYRKRAGIFEITVRRGAVRGEFQTLLAKLEMHRMSTSGSLVTLIKGNKRFRLGKLTEINMRYLRELVENCLEQYGSCGLEITETDQAGEGALYKSSVHNKRFKAKARKNKGITRQTKLRSIYE